MRFLYLYNPDDSHVVDQRDVTELSDADIESLKIEMIFRAKFPLEVLDSAADGPLHIGSWPDGANSAADNMAG
jgi:hypothetical protein